MAQKSRRWLVIGGGVVGGLVLLCLIAFMAFTLLGPATGSTFSGAAGSPVLEADMAARQALSGEMPPAAPDMGMGGGGGAADGFFAEESLALPTQSAIPAGNQQQAQERLIIRNGSVSVYVENTYSAEKSIEAMVSQMAGEGAFVVSTNESPAGFEQSPYINMTIRVPAKSFDSTMEAIAQMAAKGTVPTLSKTGEDVTDQYVDVKARLASLEAARDRLRQIMAEAQNTNDLLLAEQQLAQREAEIEALKGRMQYLEQSAALSSISITLQPYLPSQPIDSSWQPGVTVREAFDRLVNSMRNFADFLIIFTISVLPFLVIFGLVVYGIVRFIMAQVRRGQMKRQAAMAAEQQDQEG